MEVFYLWADCMTWLIVNQSKCMNSGKLDEIYKCAYLSRMFMNVGWKISKASKYIIWERMGFMGKKQRWLDRRPYFCLLCYIEVRRNINECRKKMGQEQLKRKEKKE